MAKTIPVPSLSVDGWIITPTKKVDKLLCYYFLSEPSQSQLYTVISLPSEIAKKGNWPNQLKEMVSNDLQTFFSAYFTEGVSVYVEIKDTDDNGNQISQYKIYSQVIVTIAGQKYSVAKMATVLNSQIVDLADA